MAVLVRAPVHRYAASPAELREQLTAEACGQPYLVFRDGAGGQRVVALPGAGRMTVGRAPACEVCLDWDTQVSGVHAQLERIGDDWTVADDGLSRNGTFVNGERLPSRHRLRDGDLIAFGSTEIAFRRPGEATAATEAAIVQAPPALTEAHRRVLVALCRPFRCGAAFPAPASNRQIADELVLTVEGVRAHLRALYQRFGVEDLAQGCKRIRLVELAFETGAVSPRDLERGASPGQASGLG